MKAIPAEIDVIQQQRAMLVAELAAERTKVTQLEQANANLKIKLKKQQRIVESQKSVVEAQPTVVGNLDAFRELKRQLETAQT